MSKETLIKSTQRDYFQDEIKLLKKVTSIPKSSKLYPLTPFLDNTGIMRIKGCLENSDLSYESGHPVILPGCWLARLLVRDNHKSMHHAGISTLINAIHQKYWIIGLRRIAKSEIKLFPMSENSSNCLQSTVTQFDQRESYQTTFFWYHWCRLCRTIICNRHK